MKINAIFDSNKQDGIGTMTNPLTGVSYKCPNNYIDKFKIEEYSAEELTFLINEGFFAKSFSDLLDFFPVVSPYMVWNENKLVFYDINETLHEMRIDKQQSYFLSLCKGQNSLNEALESCMASEADFASFLQFCISEKNQIIKLLSCKVDSVISNSFFPMRVPLMIAHKKPPHTNNSEYYRNLSRDDVVDQFVTNETTISFMLRKETSILSNQSYGKYLFTHLYKCFDQSKVVDGLSVLEIGAGLGDVAVSILRDAPPKCISDYSICDVSKAMLSFQKERLGDCFNGTMIHYIHGDLLKIDMNKKYHLIICNEVVADFPSSSFDCCLNVTAKSIAASLGYSANDYINTGAIDFISHLDKLLHCGGVAFISEYSEPDYMPKISAAMNDHQETSIDFRVLELYSTALGLDSKLLSLASFLNVDKDVKVVSPYSFYLLQSIYTLEKQFLSLEDLEEVNVMNFQNIRMVDISNYMKFFMVLILRNNQ